MPRSPTDPSVIDMRNAIELAIDDRYHDSADYEKIFDIFWTQKYNELTTDQMVVEEQEEKTAPGLSFEAMLGRQAREPAAPTGPPPLVDPEDITFEPDEAEMKAPAPSPPPVVRAPVLPPPLTVAPPPPLTPRPIPPPAGPN